MTIAAPTPAELAQLRRDAEEARFANTAGEGRYEYEPRQRNADLVLLLLDAYEQRPRETSASIEKWRQDTFGSCFSEGRLVDRANDEFFEFQCAVDDEHARGTYEKACREAADVVVCLHSFVARHGFDLQKLVDEKMQINRGRRWRLNGDGTRQHIKEPIE